MRSSMRFILVLGALALLAATCANAQLPGLKRDFTYKEADGAVDVLRDGVVVARYVYKDTPRPYIYPLIAPNGEQVTRSYPMKKVAGEPTDHSHHRSFWIGFGDVNGVDFWTDGEKSGKIVQKSIDFKPLSPGYWSIHTINEWIGSDGAKVCEDERYVTFMSCDHGILINTVLLIKATEAKLVFGDNKEGFFAVRLAPPLQLAGGSGHILNSEGQKDNECWGKPARWCDYTGEINGKTCGITMFDSPLNHGHPTYWHVRDYGLFAANPFGGETFTQNPENNSSLTIERGGSSRFLYSVLVHDKELDAKTLDTIAAQAVGRGYKSAPIDNAETAPGGMKLDPMPLPK